MTALDLLVSAASLGVVVGLAWRLLGQIINNGK